MNCQSDDEDDVMVAAGQKRRPLYTIRQPPLIQPLRLSEFTQKARFQLGIPPDDLAHEWVALFQAIVGGGIGEGMQLQIPDTVLLSPSGHPSVWYTTSSTGRIKAKELMRVAPQAILEAFQMPLSRRDPSPEIDDTFAVRRLGFATDTFSLQQLKVFCKDMEHPSISLPLETNSARVEENRNVLRSGLTKGAFCLQRYIPCQQNVRFLIVWRHLPRGVAGDSKRKSFRPPPGNANSERDRKIADSYIRCTRRVYSDAFLLLQAGVDSEYASDECTTKNEDPEVQTRSMTTERCTYLDIDHPENSARRALRLNSLDPDVVIPSLFYMRRVTSEIANCINRERNTRQTCGLACEFFVGAHDRTVYFSALQGIQWIDSLPSWELLRTVHPLSRSICEFYECTGGLGSPLSKGHGELSSPHNARSPNKASYYEQNPRFPSIHTPFASEKQWLHRSQVLAPDISPRYVGASVPKIYRDGEFRPLLMAYQADSVIRLNFSLQAPSSLSKVLREQPHLSPRSGSPRKTTTISANESARSPTHYTYKPSEAGVEPKRS